MPAIGYFFWSCWPLHSHKPPNITGYCLGYLGYPLECVGKITLLRTPHTKAIDEIYETWWNQGGSALLVSLNSSGRCYAEEHSNCQSYWEVNPASCNGDWPGRSFQHMQNSILTFWHRVSEEATLSATFSPRHREFIEDVPSERWKYIKGFDSWHNIWDF